MPELPLEPDTPSPPEPAPGPSDPATPLAATPFRDDRWDYVGYSKPPRGEVTQRTVSIYFEGDQLARLEGAEEQRDANALSRPDADAVIKADKIDRANARRSAEENDSDIILNPDERRP